jgi:hypothetical protein
LPLGRELGMGDDVLLHDGLPVESACANLAY